MRQPSPEARALWEKLYNAAGNEKAWEIIEEAFEGVRLRLLEQLGEGGKTAEHVLAAVANVEYNGWAEK